MLFLLSVIIVAGLVFGIWKVLGNKPAAVSEATAQDFEPLLLKYVSFYRRLPEAGRVRFLSRVRQFLSYVRIEGVGFTPEPLDHMLVAASAIIPIFAFDGWRYPNITNVILYPDTFNQDFQYEGEGRDTLGMVGTGYMNGQMLLSRKGLLDGFTRDDGRNTGIHEFVHLLDKTDGNTDGRPEYLLDKDRILPWVQLMHREMKRISSGRSDIDPYALTNEAEFFAVVSEYFFEKPDQLKSSHPELYRLLEEMFTNSNDDEKQA